MNVLGTIRKRRHFHVLWRPRLVFFSFFFTLRKCVFASMRFPLKCFSLVLEGESPLPPFSWIQNAKCNLNGNEFKEKYPIRTYWRVNDIVWIWIVWNARRHLWRRRMTRHVRWRRSISMYIRCSSTMRWCAILQAHRASAITIVAEIYWNQI